MYSQIDPKLFDKLSQTVNSLVPAIQADIARFILNPDERQSLENAYQNVHPIKDVADMLGLSVLHYITGCLENMIEDIATRAEPLEQDQSDRLYHIVNQVQPYLHSIQADDGSEHDIVSDVVTSFRRFKGLSEDEDSIAIADVISQNLPEDGTPSDTQCGATNTYVNQSSPEEGWPAGIQDVSMDETDLMDFSAELLEGFLLEAEDYLDTIGRILPNIGDQAEQNHDLLQVRRSVHTLKGAAGVVGLSDVSQLAHRMEDFLDELYDGNIALTAQGRDLLFATFDVLEDFLRDKGAQGDLGPGAENLYATYDLVLGASSESSSVAIPDSAAADEAMPTAATWSTGGEEALEAKWEAEPEEAASSSVAQPSDVVRVPIGRLDELVRLVGELVISRSVYEQHLTRLNRQVEELHLSIERLQRTATTIETQYEVSALMGSRAGANREARGQLNRVSPEWTGIIEFDELEFDRYSEFHLMSRDLVETSADVGALGHEFRDILGDFDSYLTRQGRLTSEIQDKLMQFRMVPLASLSTRLHRAVRVTAKQRHKDVNFELIGEDVQFDKTMLEELNEALLHILRNAVDHGIESCEQRAQVGKPACGNIQLQAYREGTQLVIEIRDDGAGLDPQKLRQKAIENGMLSPEEAGQWRDEQLYSLIFTPGFSTASAISEVSGRGVGMDIVSVTVNRLKGRITVDSVLGQGVTIAIRVPLTLALARVLLVGANEQTFAIPLADVNQVVHLGAQALEKVGETRVVRLDGNVFPLVSLCGEPTSEREAEELVDRLPIVLAQAGNEQVAILVDQLLGGREVVVKTLGTHLRHVHGIIGSTLMGDGSIVLILNPSELMQGSQRQPMTKALKAKASVRASETFEILVVDDSFSVRRVVANLVKSAGWNPILAKNGLEALDIIQRAAKLPDLMLLDVEMPQMDGYELTSTLRANEAYRDLPIVMLTSRSGDKHRRKAFEVGATEYVVKPYQDAALLSMVRHLITQARGTTAA